MANANSYLAISNGTFTVTIMNTSGVGGFNSASAPTYALKYAGWSPNVTRRRNVILGGQDQYEEVTEEIEIIIRGTNATACLAALDTLVQVLDRATRWYFDTPSGTAATVLHYGVKGGSIADMSSLVVRANPIDRYINLPKDFNAIGDQSTLIGVTLQLIRRGLWFDTAAPETASGAAQNSGTIWNIALTNNLTTYTPFEITSLGTFGASPAASMTAYLLVSSSSTYLQKIDPSGMASGKFTSVADAANKADGNILRFTPTVASETGTTALMSVPVAGNANAAELSFYATVRNNNASASFQVAVDCYIGSTVFYTTPYVTIAAGTTNPRVMYLGSMQIPNDQISTQISQIGLRVIAPTSLTGTPTLDFDTIIIQTSNDDNASAVYLNLVPSASGAASPNLVLRHRPFAYRQPYIAINGGGNDYPQSYDGNLAVYSISNNVTMCFLAVTSNYWRAVDSGGTLLSLTPALRRVAGYLVAR